MLTPDVSVALKDIAIDCGVLVILTFVGETTRLEILGPTKSAPELFVTDTALEMEPVPSPYKPLTSTALNEPKE